MTAEEAEQQLRDWAATVARRDDLFRAARRAGISKNRIHVLTGVSRTTIDRIPGIEETMTGIDEDAAAYDFDITVKMLRSHGVDITLIDRTPDGVFLLTAEDGHHQVAFGRASEDDPDNPGGWDWTGSERAGREWEQITQDWAPTDEAMATVLKGWT